MEICSFFSRLGDGSSDGFAFVLRSAISGAATCSAGLFSSRSRHTRCALVTGGTCALPISAVIVAECASFTNTVHGIEFRPGKLRETLTMQIGRASCRERVCQYV